MNVISSKKPKKTPSVKTGQGPKWTESKNKKSLISSASHESTDGAAVSTSSSDSVLFAETSATNPIMPSIAPSNRSLLNNEGSVKVNPKYMKYFGQHYFEESGNSSLIFCQCKVCKGIVLLPAIAEHVGGSTCKKLQARREANQVTLPKVQRKASKTHIGASKVGAQGHMPPPVKVSDRRKRQDTLFAGNRRNSGKTDTVHKIADQPTLELTLKDRRNSGKTDTVHKIADQPTLELTLKGAKQNILQDSLFPDGLPAASNVWWNYVNGSNSKKKNRERKKKSTENVIAVSVNKEVPSNTGRNNGLTATSNIQQRDSTQVLSSRPSEMYSKVLSRDWEGDDDHSALDFLSDDMGFIETEAGGDATSMEYDFGEDNPFLSEDPAPEQQDENTLSISKISIGSQPKLSLDALFKNDGFAEIAGEGILGDMGFNEAEAGGDATSMENDFGEANLFLSEDSAQEPQDENTLSVSNGNKPKLSLDTLLKDNGYAGIVGEGVLGNIPEYVHNDSYEYWSDDSTEENQSDNMGVNSPSAALGCENSNQLKVNETADPPTLEGCENSNQLKINETADPPTLEGCENSNQLNINETADPPTLEGYGNPNQLEINDSVDPPNLKSTLEEDMGFIEAEAGGDATSMEDDFDEVNLSLSEDPAQEPQDENTLSVSNLSIGSKPKLALDTPVKDDGFGGTVGEGLLGNFNCMQPKVLLHKLSHEIISAASIHPTPPLDPTLVREKQVTSASIPSDTSEHSAENDPNNSFLKQMRLFVPGQIIWTKLGNWNIWPCMVTEDPSDEDKKYSKFVKAGVIYHVQYFGTVQRGWTIPGNSFPFHGLKAFFDEREKLEKKKKALNNPREIKTLTTLIDKLKTPTASTEWNTSIAEAEEAFKIADFEERLDNYLFEYKGSFKSQPKNKKRFLSEASNSRPLKRKKQNTSVETPETSRDISKIVRISNLKKISINLQQKLPHIILLQDSNSAISKLFVNTNIPFVQLSEKESDNHCSICQKTGTLLICDKRNCVRAYHLSCIGLKEVPPGCWFCNKHCNICGENPAVIINCSSHHQSSKSICQECSKQPLPDLFKCQICV